MFRRGFEKIYVYFIFFENYIYLIKLRLLNVIKVILIFFYYFDLNMILIIKVMMFGIIDIKDFFYMKKGFVGYKILIIWGFFYKLVKGISGFDNLEYRKFIEFLV